MTTPTDGSAALPADVLAFLRGIAGDEPTDALLREAQARSDSADLNEAWIADARLRAAELLEAHGGR